MTVPCLRCVYKSNPLRGLAAGTQSPSGRKDRLPRNDANAILVRGFDRSLSEEEVRQALQGAFEGFGAIVGIRVIRDKAKPGGLKGIAFIEFKEAASKARAVAKEGSLVRLQ